MRLKARANFLYDGIAYAPEDLLDAPDRDAVVLIGQDCAMIWNLEDPNQRSKMATVQAPRQGQGAPFFVILTYRADTSTTAANDPGTGLVRWNATAVEDVTALYFDRLTADNNNDVTAMWAMVNPTKIIIQEANLALNQQVWIVTGPAQNRMDWFEVPVAPDALKGDVFKPKDQTRLLVFITGG
jgi:hypothetical protein